MVYGAWPAAERVNVLAGPGLKASPVPDKSQEDDGEGDDKARLRLGGRFGGDPS
jgi:hypothetical protein